VIWWLRVRRVHSVLTASVGVFLLLTCVLGDDDILLPAFSVSVGNSVALASFTPLLVVGAVGQCLDARLASAELTGLRPIRWMDTALVAVATGIVLAGSAAAATLLDSTTAAQAGRNTAFLTGLLLLGRGSVGRAAIMTPLCWVFAVVFFGRESAAAYHGWAVTGQGASSASAAVAAAVVFAAGLVVNHYLSRKAP
jgi:hypothetical protein